MTFQEELTGLLNKHRQKKGSGTPKETTVRVERKRRAREAGRLLAEGLVSVHEGAFESARISLIYAEYWASLALACVDKDEAALEREHQATRNRVGSYACELAIADEECSEEGALIIALAREIAVLRLRIAPSENMTKGTPYD